jgi:hypothetical protein
VHAQNHCATDGRGQLATNGGSARMAVIDWRYYSILDGTLYHVTLCISRHLRTCASPFCQHDAMPV